MVVMYQRMNGPGEQKQDDGCQNDGLDLPFDENSNAYLASL